MNTVFAQFARSLIILLMLFTQSAMIDHAIGHAESEHTEHCAAFTSADNLTVCDTNIVSFDVVGLTDSWVKLQSQSFIQIRFVNHLSRAPPYLFTV